MNAKALVSSFAAIVIAVGAGAAMRADSPQGQEPIPFGQGALSPGPGVQNPILVLKVTPKYTAAARRAGIQGEVELDAVVRTDGAIGEVRVARSLDKAFGLDDQAIEAARQWTFQPARLANGKPVPIIVKLVLQFKLPEGPVPSDQAPVLSAAALQAKDQELKELEFLSGVYRVGPGVPAPKATATAYPKYTAEAMRQKIQGEVVVEAVVDAEGNVIRARVKQSLDSVYGLDENAIAAAREFKFDRASINPDTAPVLVQFQLEFKLH